jgi:hypothetical protein
LQVNAQLRGVLKVNSVHAKTPGVFEVQWAVVDEKAVFGLALGDFESDAKNIFFGLAAAEVAGAEENLKVAAKRKSFDAVFVEFEWLIVDGADEIFSGARQGGEDGARVGEFPGLGEHEGCEFFAREGTGAVEESAVEILVELDVTSVESGKRKFMAVLKFFPIEMKSGGGFAAGTAIPAIGEDHAADVKEESRDFGQVRWTSVGVLRAATMN